MLTEEQLGVFIDEHFSHQLFRLETLDRYDVGTDDQDFHRYIRGESAPNAAGKQEWLDILRAEVAAGKFTKRVRVVNGPLSDYLRYECEWGYRYNAEAGEDIRILDLSERPLSGDLKLREDFFVVEDEWVLRMRYDHHGAYIGSAVVTGESVPAYVNLRDVLWDAAEPFGAWWDKHPQYWRRNWAA